MKKLFLFALFFVTIFSSCKKKEEASPTVNLILYKISPLFAEPGQILTITGQDFISDISAFSVKFPNGVSVKPKTASTDKITVEVPTDAGTGNITVSMKNTRPFVYPDIFTCLDPNRYKVKVIAISRMRVVLDANEKISLAEFVGGGNRIIVKAGSGNQMELVSGAPPQLFDPAAGTYPKPNYPESSDKTIDNANPPDTSGIVGRVKLKGFDRSKTGYDELQLVLVKETIFFDGGWPRPNLHIIYMPSVGEISKYNDAYFKNAFKVPVMVTTVEIPVIAKPYITRDAIASEVQILYDAANGNKARFLNFADFANGILKLDISTSNAKAVGGPLKTELVNANKGTLTYNDKALKDYFQPLFSNIKRGDYGQIVDPADTVNNVFIRVTGFDASICGFNQLRLFLTEYKSNAGYSQLYYPLKTPKETLTLPFIEQTLKTSGLSCTQVIVL